MILLERAILPVVAPSQDSAFLNHFNPLTFLSPVPSERRYIYSKKEFLL
jgi:hypothetical protein